MRALIFAAAAVVGLSFAGPAQARIAHGGLNLDAPTAVQEVQYRDRRHYRGHRAYRHHSRRHRHCWNQRVRVRTPSGRVIVRTTRRCAWR